MSQVLISVIVPCYNQAQYLDECLQSVLDQSYPNWECIIVNDGSPDNTEEVALRWTEKDARFIYLKKENGGVASARNFGIERAKGEWILPLDGDDKIGNQYLELAEKEFNKGYKIIYCKAEFFGEKSGEMVLKPFNPADLLIENQIFCSAFFTKESWKIVGGYDEKMIHGLEDWEFWISYLSSSPEINIFRLDSVLFSYRIKKESRNINVSKNTALRTESWTYIYTKHINLYNQYHDNFFELIYKQNRLQRELKIYKDFYFSKRIKMFNKLLSIIGK